MSCTCVCRPRSGCADSSLSTAPASAAPVSFSVTRIFASPWYTVGWSRLTTTAVTVTTSTAVMMSHFRTRMTCR